jgi:hypothetical protein
VSTSISVDLIYDFLVQTDVDLIDRTDDKELPLILNDILTEGGQQELERRFKNPNKKEESKMAKTKSKIINLVWALGIKKTDLKNLRKDVEKTIADPEYFLMLNYEIHWEKIEIDKNKIQVIWSEGASKEDIKDLKKQLDMALIDPDYPIVVNYQVVFDQI